MLVWMLACWGPGPAQVDVGIEDCWSSGDEDGDGVADCADPDCWGSGCAEDCASDDDDDGDGNIGCDDMDCWGAECSEDCANSGDEDGDTLADCDDADCWGPDCTEDCSQPGDEDGDGHADCADDDCQGRPLCQEDCSDGEDNDHDGLVDCEDDDCMDACFEDACWDGEDQDGDGLTDCEDDDCWGTEACTERTLQVQSGTLSWDVGHRWIHDVDKSRSGSGWSTSVSDHYWVSGSVHARDLRGVVWIDTGGAIHSCAWSLDHIGGPVDYASFPSVASPTVSGFQSSGSCGFAPSNLGVGVSPEGPGRTWAGSGTSWSHSTVITSSVPGTVTTYGTGYQRRQETVRSGGGSWTLTSGEARPWR